MFTKKKKAQKRKLLVLTLVVSMLCSSMTVPLQAVGIVDSTTTSISVSEIQPYWINARRMTLTLSLAESKIFISSTVTGNPGTTYKDCIITLEKISVSNCGVKGKWTGLSANNQIFTFTDQSITRERVTYRLTLTITTVGSNGTERITGYKDSTY